MNLESSLLRSLSRLHRREASAVQDGSVRGLDAGAALLVASSEELERAWALEVEIETGVLRWLP